MQMKRRLRKLSIFLLVLNSIPALLAGWNLMMNPSGSGLRMDVGLLEFTPFHNFLVPGIILFTMNGLLSLFTLTFLLMKKVYYPLLVSCQGLILTGWITVQIVMIRDSSWLQLTYGFVGLALLTTGMLLENIQKTEKIYQKV